MFLTGWIPSTSFVILNSAWSPYTNTANQFVSHKYRLSSMTMKDGPNFLSLSLCCGSVTRQRQVWQHTWLMHAKMTLCACRQNYMDIKCLQLRPNIFSRTCHLGTTSNILQFSHHNKFPTQYIQLKKKIWCSIGAFFWLSGSLFLRWFWKLSNWECLLG